MGPSGAVSCSAKGSSGGIIDKRKREKEAYPSAGTSLQGFAHRFNYSCKSVPADVLLRPFRTAGRRGQFHVVYPGKYFYGSVPVGLYL